MKKQRYYVSTIKKNVPLPPLPKYGGGAGNAIYPFALMLVGDMFETNCPNVDYIARNWARRNNVDWKFAARVIEKRDGMSRLGLWRVE